MAQGNDVKTIKALRDATGLSFGQISKALTEAGGDQAKAMDILKTYGAQIAAKKSERQVKEGTVAAYVHTTKKVGSLVELLCETDFVAKNSEFQQLAYDLAMHIAAFKPADAAELLAQPFVKDQDMTVQDLINQAVGKLGENIQIGEFAVFVIS